MEANSAYTVEAVSAVVPMYTITSATAWNYDVWVANRGNADGAFQVDFIGQRGSFEDPVIISNQQIVVGPDRIFLVGLDDTAHPGATDFECWWSRIRMTSRNLVPTVHFHVEGAQTPETPGDPPIQQFFFGPADFAYFKLTGSPASAMAP